MTIKDGGPAFPAENDANLNNTMGMSLRDWLAGQALVSLGTWTPMGFGELASDAARERRAIWAYRQADAMLAVRESKL